jgi:hypothetical protein
MTKEELTAWALKSGWRLIDDHPSLCRPGRPKDAIVRLVLKGTVANVEIRKPSGKWEKVAGAAYKDITADPEGGMPEGLNLASMPGLGKLMQDNRDAQVFGG